MSARDDLADLIFRQAYDPSVGYRNSRPAWVDHLARAMREAGYREPARFATTEEELDTLPEGTVVMTHTVWLRVRSAHGRLVWGCVGDTEIYSADIVMADTVATVIYEPKEES